MIDSWHTNNSNKFVPPLLPQRRFEAMPYLTPLQLFSPANRTYCNGAAAPPDDQQQCDACLYTGVATCTGLSLYFFKMAYLDLPEASLTKQQLTSQQRFLTLMGGTAAIAGAYRWYLG